MSADQQTTPQPAPAPMSRDQIREVFMAHGFTVKEGQTDLKQYVYDAAYALLELVEAPPAEQQAQPGAVYAELPQPDSWFHFTAQFWENKLRDFADRTHALRMEQAAPKAAPGEVSDTQHSQFLSDVLTAAGLVTHGKQCKALGERLADMVMRLRAAPQREAQEPVGWDGAEEWEKLAWHLCAEENGEDACNELIWEGGPMPEPWGDRWLKYEGEARRMIDLVRTHVPAPQPAPARLSDDVVQKTWALLDELEKLRGADRYDEDWDTLNKRDSELRAVLAAQGGK